MFIGSLLLLLGALMLLEKLDIIYGPVWDYFLPVALVALGLSMIFKSGRKLPWQ